MTLSGLGSISSALLLCGDLFGINRRPSPAPAPLPAQGLPACWRPLVLLLGTHCAAGGVVDIVAALRPGSDDAKEAMARGARWRHLLVGLMGIGLVASQSRGGEISEARGGNRAAERAADDANIIQQFEMDESMRPLTSHL